MYLSGLNVWQSSNFPDNLSDILCLNEVQKLTMFFLNLQNTVTLDFALTNTYPDDEAGMIALRIRHLLNKTKESF